MQCLKTVSDYASQPEEFYSSLSKKQWLRIVVNCKSKDALVLCTSADFYENDFTIQCNVVPCEPYWEKLQRARSSQDNQAGAPISKGVYFPSSSLENHELFQLTRDDQQEHNVLKDWIERYDSEMIDRRTDMLHPRPLRREIKPSNEDLIIMGLSPRSNLETNGRFQKEVWRGGFFGVKVFRKEEENIFLDEVKVLETIGIHPHIVHSFGVSKPEGKDGYKYWMEKLDTDLYDFLLEWNRQSSEDSNPTPFPVIDSMNILLQIAKAMTRLHQLNVIHGDLNAGNILISHYEVLGDVMLYIVKVADFDRAEILESEDEVVHITGTDEYIAPEVWKGRPAHAQESGSSNEEFRTDPPGTPLSGSNAKKCDVYSFGIVAVEVLTGEISEGKQKKGDHDRRDVIMEPLETIRISQEYPDRLTTLVARCLNHDSALRPSFEEVTRELERIINVDVSN